MKTIVAITLIVVGAVLIAAPVAAIVIESSTYQSNLVAYFVPANKAEFTRLLKHPKNQILRTMDMSRPPV